MQSDAERFAEVGRSQMFTMSSLHVLIRNISIVATVKHVSQLGGFTNPPEWEQWMFRRVGNEPIARLMFVAFRDMEQAGIRLDEVLAYDPERYVICMQENQIPLYYELHPLASRAPFQ